MKHGHAQTMVRMWMAGAVTRRALRDVATCLLWLTILALAVGGLLDQAGASRLAYPSVGNSSGDAELEALLSAIGTADVPEVRRLLRRGGTDVNGCDASSATPLHYAVISGAKADVLVELLIDAGADVNAGGTHCPLLVHAASAQGPEIVERLLRGGADPNVCNRAGWTALHSAAMCDDAATVGVLRRGGADPLARDDEGHTPLDVARAYGASAAESALPRGHRDSSGTGAAVRDYGEGRERGTAASLVRGG